MALKTAKPKTFQVKLDRVGTDSLNGGYSIIKDKTAMKLALQSNYILSENFVGKERQGNFLYELALFILSDLNPKVDIKEIEKDLITFRNADSSKVWVLED